MKQALHWAENMKLSKTSLYYYGAYSLAEKVDIYQRFTQNNRSRRLGTGKSIGAREKLCLVVAWSTDTGRFL